MIVAGWPDDDTLVEAESRVQAKFRELQVRAWQLDDDLSFAVFPGLRTCLAFDPEDIRREFEAIQITARRLGDSEEAELLFSRIENNTLDGWNGEAAIAFLDRVTAIHRAASVQREHILAALASRAAVYQIAVDARRNHLELARATVSAIDIALGEMSERAAKGAVSVLADLGKDLANLDPTKLLGSGISMLISVTKGTVDMLIGGSEYEQIVDTFVAESRKLADGLSSDLLAVRQKMQDDHYNLSTEVAESVLQQPLPAAADVDSPDFSYSAFWHDGREPAQFEDKVATEQAEMKAEESTIHRRLKGAL
ncbi:hypothetical protein [Actinokineospora sp. UTMC 2448]|uniref:hypothetical protein n=1 Tax=Actinokineospora sp. UTMC 2448 TaxID=2268449 RepID=UPI0021646270|nr:hypothetical protein [Actinokineospora sp. UTMC 2448]